MIVRALLCSALLLPAAARAGLAQTTSTPAAHEHEGQLDGHDDDHDHGHLHFSHPLVTESPSPDTKIRVDYRWMRQGAAPDRSVDREVAVEGEYEFAEGMSLAVTVPYVTRHDAGLPAVHGVGSTELSLKAASLRWGDRGVLVGGGLSTALPTGSDLNGIGSSHVVELEPFVDVGVKRGKAEVAAFLNYGTTVRNPAGTAAERELTFDGSLLYPVAPAIEVLMETELARPLSGDGQSVAASLAPGVKLYPFHNRALMFGVSAPIGVSGEATDARSIIVAAFYHF